MNQPKNNLRKMKCLFLQNGSLSALVIPMDEVPFPLKEQGLEFS